MNSYYNELISSRRCDPVSRRKEADLARRIKIGDQTAKNRLISSGLRFVVAVARKYTSSGLPIDDLIQAGNLGLYKAAERFDANRNMKFVSYAVWWIRREILQEISNHSRAVRIPINKTKEMSHSRKAHAKREQDNLGQLTYYHEADVLSLSISQPIDQTRTDITIGDTLQYPDTYDDERSDMIRIINCELNKIPDRERTVLCAHFGLNNYGKLTLSEIGRLCGISRERARQLNMQAIERIQDSKSAERLRDYCG